MHNALTVQSVNGAPALIELVPDAIKLLATNLDLLGKTIDIVESYMLLEGAQILQVSPMLGVHMESIENSSRSVPLTCLKPSTRDSKMSISPSTERIC